MQNLNFFPPFFPIFCNFWHIFEKKNINKWTPLPTPKISKKKQKIGGKRGKTLQILTCSESKKFTDKWTNEQTMLTLESLSDWKIGVYFLKKNTFFYFWRPSGLQHKLFISWAQYILFWLPKTMIRFFSRWKTKKVSETNFRQLAIPGIYFPDHFGPIWLCHLIENHERIPKWYKTCPFSQKWDPLEGILQLCQFLTDFGVSWKIQLFHPPSIKFWHK